MHALPDLSLQIIYDQPSFTISTEQVFLAVTRFGGHMAPVEFYRDSSQPIMPYHIAPWWDEGLKSDQPPLLHVLRGDFFCCPFGGNDELHDGVSYPPHGETANRPWSLVHWSSSTEGAVLTLSQEQTLRPGFVEKKLALLPRHNLVYAQHSLSEMEGKINPGHHANLRFPDVPQSGHLAFSKLIHAQVYVHPTEMPENKGYSILQPGAVFQDLRKAPMITGEMADLTRYPARRGFEDIVILCSDPALDFAWTSVTFPEQGYVWFALKDPKVLASTLLWMSNGGRHYEPWNGRHINVMGLEEITGYFHEGIHASVRENSLNRLGIPTAIELSKLTPTNINYIQGVARIPQGFDQVAEINRTGDSEITLISQNQKTVAVPCALDFLQSGVLPGLIS